jgi:hypothetical protein
MCIMVMPDNAIGIEILYAKGYFDLFIKHDGNIAASVIRVMVYQIQ